MSNASAPKKLKPSKHRLTLLDGRELQYHVPRPEEFEPLDLASKLPPDVLDRLEVEIGCGKGEFISRRASEHPLRFYVGIDRRKDRFDLTERKLERKLLNNWLVINEDACCFAKAKLPPIQTLHVYHPDPWPKERHHKHRFFRSPDARLWAQAIVPGGEFRLSTDHRGYFEEILDILATWDFVKPELVFEKKAGMSDPLTHFEGIFLRKKEPVYKAVYRRL
jgi:tRNA (guanine-N7-)-methyltransferase